MNTLWRDVRYGLRTLVRRPGFTAVVVLILALGIGANTAIFSVLNTVLLKPLPYAGADRLVILWGNFLKLNITNLRAKAAEYVDYRDQNHVFSEIAAFQNQDFALAGDPEPERVVGSRVTANLFSLLGAKAAIGRTLLAEENAPGREHVMVLSHGLWKRRFGGDPAVVGRTLALANEKFEVVGVMPENFAFPHPSFPFAERAELWTPLAFTPQQIAERQGGYEFNVIARLKDGVTVDEARTDMSAIAQRLEERHRGYRGPNGEDGGWRISVSPLYEEISGKSRRPLIVLLGIAGLVLLIACANVANLMLVRASARRKELAIRSALGASRRRIIRQLLTETALLVLAGGGAGLLLAFWGLKLLVAIGARQLPRLDEVSIDTPVLLFTLALSVLAGLICGLAPAWRTADTHLKQALSDSGNSAITRQERLREFLIIGEIAVAACVLVGAGLLVKSFLRLQRVDSGMDPRQVLTFEIALPSLKYPNQPQVADFYERVLTRIAALPGVQSVGMSSVLPLSGVAIDDPFSIEGRPLDMKRLTVAGHQAVSPDFFKTLGISLARGRHFTNTDALGAPAVAVINEQMAQRFFSGEDPIGLRIKLGAPRAPGEWATIVGVVKNIPHKRLDSEAQPDWYLAHQQAPARRMTVFVRTATATEPLSFASAIRREVLAVDGDLPVTNMQKMADAIAETLSPRRFNTLLAGVFGFLALMLAAGGIYSVVSYSVLQRTHEIGIRMALGAQKSDVLRLVILRCLVLTVIGLAIGLPAAAGASRVVKSLLFNVSATDFATFALIGLLLIGVSLVACLSPARRAATVDPIVALRYE